MWLVEEQRMYTGNSYVRTDVSFEQTSRTGRGGGGASAGFEAEKADETGTRTGHVVIVSLLGGPQAVQ